MPLDSSSSYVPSCSCSLIRFPLVLPCAGFEGVFWSWFRADGQRVGVLIRVLGSFVGGCSHWMGWGSLCPGAGGPARYLQLHLHQEDSVMVGEDLVYSLTVTLL